MNEEENDTFGVSRQCETFIQIKFTSKMIVLVLTPAPKVGNRILIEVSKGHFHHSKLDSGVLM